MVGRPRETFKMETNFEGLIQLLARHLYADPDVFVRELIQNAHDSIILRQSESEDVSGRIEIEVHPKDGMLIFRDNGIGMDEDDIKKFLSVIGSTGTGSLGRKLQAEGREAAFELIGQFGIGMLSAFVVATKVVVRTRKSAAAGALAWHNSGSTTCELYDDDKPGVGTEVILHVGPEHGYLVDSRRITETVIRYCDFIRFPINVDGKGPVNAMDAPWHRDVWHSPSEKLEAYRQYLGRRYHNETPLTVIPIDIEGECRARGALYISDRNLPDLDTTGVVDIFVRRMFVRADDVDLLPPWAKFVRGLVDSPDLLPTAARDNVQRTHSTFAFLREQLGRLIVEHLADLARNERNTFVHINLWHHYHLKGMALVHDDFFAQVADLLLFETNRNLMSLEEYLTKNAPRPETGNKAPIYYFAFAGAAAQFYRLADATGWCVINAGAEFDEALLEKYSMYNAGRVWLQRLDATDDPAIFQRLSREEEESFRQLEANAEWALRRAGVTNIDVRMRRFAPPELPAVIILTPESEAELKLRDIVIQPWFRSQLEDVANEALERSRTRPVYLQLNATNPLVRELALLNREPVAQELTYAMYTSAVLYSRNLLTHDNAEAIHRQFLRLCGRVMGQHNDLAGLRDTVERERREALALRESHAALVARRPPHVLLFMITPFSEEYAVLEQAVRRVFEREPYFFEVMLARDHTYKPGLLDNVREHMGRAHGFIAEISDLNPNVMLELGATMFTGDDRPIFSLRHQNARQEVPSDLKEKLYIPYGSPSDGVEELAAAIRRAVERDGQSSHEGIGRLVAARSRRHLSATLLRSLDVRLTDAEVSALRRICTTVEDLLTQDQAALAERTGLRPYKVNAICEMIRELADGA
ncbi:ATP-binding protein [Streptosporangium roseum]|uniref:Molecular chaperone HSP90 family-like protein n=1 Tax=Streptosporangium roseum (strain ATCC 12428 / DSM 43021 / JCM 3005 / KCTC 9067 / NCIMB 10171 / NRRL 2505 / NI 9100) TaxID=479432 RepID=D2ARC5_STRRD|nr:ATP-binding protein [Streptosporangium roseum]ACZ88466.1 Molecular chaperone HSP90 family-like protein [Streptosporangium roseum DSM 43021]